MFKKLMATALLVCAIPAMASAWTLTTQAMSAGGTITSVNKTGQASIDGAMATSGLSAPETPTISVDPGYVISKIKIDNVVVYNAFTTDSKGTAVLVTPAPAMPSLTLNGATDEALEVTFRVDAANVVNNATATVSGNGSVTPSAQAIIKGAGGTLVQPLVFKFVPARGNQVTAVDVVGAAFTTTPAVIATARVNQIVTVTIPAGTILAGGVTLSGTFTTGLGVEKVAYAGPQTTVVAAPADYPKSFTLTGKSLGAAGTFSKWSSVSRPAGAAPIATQTGAAAATYDGTFSAPVAGKYTFLYRIDQPAVGQQVASVVTVTVGSAAAGVSNCITCHNANGVGAASNVNANWTASTLPVCYTCHVGAESGAHPGVLTVAETHVDKGLACVKCHNSSATITAPVSGAHGNAARCIDCHAVGQNAGAAFVQDNSGVRSITTEFSKWSHHVTGVALQDAHCAACHLEGKAVNGKIVVDKLVHMTDAKIHLRNAGTDADMQWDPAAPNHSTMDNFCMSCHSATGYNAPSAAAIQAIMVPAAGKTASASNPFGDTISNRYDKMQRPAVVNVDGQFDLTNNSHHAVKGPKYTGRTRVEASRVIASPATFTANSSATLFGARSTIYDAGTFNALYTPLENTGGETAPRTGAASLGDDSTLHCGDCHTVGQWKAGTAKFFNADGTVDATKTSPAIGAHGSNNEYLLRNSKGTDARHTQSAYTVAAGVVTLTNPNGAFLVCFNCHAFNKYGSAFNATGTAGSHAGEYASGGRCNGAGNTIPFNGYTTGTATDGTQFGSRFEGPVTKYSSAALYAGEQNADFGNALGMQCANCHNSGAGNAYGGIHGSKNNQTLAGYTNDPSVTGGSYIDGMGNTTKIVRFLPGLGDAMHVPGTLGGVTGGTVAKFSVYSSDKLATPQFTELPVRDNRTAVNAKAGSYNFITGGVTNDTNWEQKGWKQSGPGSTTNAAQQQAAGAGCYTLGNAAAATPGSVFAQDGKIDKVTGLVIPQRPTVMENLEGPSQGVAGQPAPEMWENWGGCDDHSAPLGGGNHGFIKRVVRPVTY